MKTKPYNPAFSKHAVAPKWGSYYDSLLFIIPFYKAGKSLPVWSKQRQLMIPFYGAAGWQEVGKYGPAMMHGGGGWRANVGSLSPATQNGQYTALTLISHSTSYYTTRNTISFGDSSGADAIFAAYIDHSAGDSINAVLDGVSLSGGSLAEGVTGMIGSSYDGTNQKIYKDGVEIATAARSFTPDPTYSYMNISRDGYSGSQTWESLFHVSYVFNRALTPNQIYQIYQDPFGLITPVNRFFAIPTSAGSLYTQTLDTTITVAQLLSKLPSRSLANTSSVVETRNKKPVTTKNTTTTATETRNKVPGKVLSQSTTVTDTKINAPRKTVNQSTTVLQTLTRALTRSIANTVTVIETRAKKPIRSVAQAVTAVETRNKIPGKLHNASSSVLATQSKQIVKSLNSAVSVTENRIKSLQRSILNGVTVLESRTKRIIKSLSQSTSVAETRAKRILRSLANSVTASETRSKIPGKVSTTTATVVETRKRDLTKVINSTVSVVVAAAKRFSLVIDNVVSASVNFSYDINSLITELTINVTVGVTTSLAKMPKVIKSAQSAITQTLHKNIARALNTSKAVTTTLSKQVIKVHGVVISAQSDISKRINKAFNTSIVVVTTAGRLFTQTINTVVVSATTMVTSINVVVEEIWRVTRQTVSFKTAQIVKSFKDTIRRVKW